MNAKEKSEKTIVSYFSEAELFEAISHPTRIRILRKLRRDASGFAKLKHKLGISSSGNLVHHLNKLATLVETDAQGKYKLTDQGHEALYAIMTITYMRTWKDWMLDTYVWMGGIFFYALYLTASILTGQANASTPLIGLFLTVILSVVYYLFTLGWRRARKSMRYLHESKWMEKLESD
jgi:DNA-binding HxlR family transcriptional regulator/uncharacterized membrane protein